MSRRCDLSPVWAELQAHFDQDGAASGRGFDLRFKARLIGHDPRGNGRIAERNHLRGEHAGVGGSGLANGDGGHRDARRHLHGR